MTPTTGSSGAGGRWLEIAAGDPEQTVEALESGCCSQPRATLKLPFDFQESCSCLTAALKEERPVCAGWGPSASGQNRPVSRSPQRCFERRLRSKT